MEDNTTVAEYDLLPTLVTKLDRHLIFPLLEFRRGQLENEDGVSKDEAKSRELLKATYELLRKTNMTDYVANLYCDLEGLQDPPKEYADKRQKVIETLEKFEDTTGKIQELLGREDVVTNLRSDKVANLEFLKKEHDVRLAWSLFAMFRAGWITGGRMEGRVGHDASDAMPDTRCPHCRGVASLASPSCPPRPETRMIGLDIRERHEC